MGRIDGPFHVFDHVRLALRQVLDPGLLHGVDDLRSQDWYGVNVTLVPIMITHVD